LSLLSKLAPAGSHRKIAQIPLQNERWIYVRASTIFQITFQKNHRSTLANRPAFENTSPQPRNHYSSRRLEFPSPTCIIADERPLFSAKPREKDLTLSSTTIIDLALTPNQQIKSNQIIMVENRVFSAILVAEERKKKNELRKNQATFASQQEVKNTSTTMPQPSQATSTMNTNSTPTGLDTSLAKMGDYDTVTMNWCRQQLQGMNKLRFLQSLAVEEKNWPKFCQEVIWRMKTLGTDVPRLRDLQCVVDVMRPTWFPAQKELSNDFLCAAFWYMFKVQPQKTANGGMPSNRESLAATPLIASAKTSERPSDSNNLVPIVTSTTTSKAHSPFNKPIPNVASITTPKLPSESSKSIPTVASSANPKLYSELPRTPKKAMSFDDDLDLKNFWRIWHDQDTGKQLDLLELLLMDLSKKMDLTEAMNKMGTIGMRKEVEDTSANPLPNASSDATSLPKSVGPNTIPSIQQPILVNDCAMDQKTVVLQAQGTQRPPQKGYVSPYSAKKNVASPETRLQNSSTLVPSDKPALPNQEQPFSPILCPETRNGTTIIAGTAGKNTPEDNINTAAERGRIKKLAQLAKDNPLKRAREVFPEDTAVANGGEWEVETVIEKRVTTLTEYLVQWKGCGIEQQEWVTAKHFSNSAYARQKLEKLAKESFGQASPSSSDSETSSPPRKKHCGPPRKSRQANLTDNF
jgi:hypothetical protein